MIQKGKRVVYTKKILWISRHDLTREQLAGLEKYCAEEITVVTWSENVETLEALAPLIEEADIIAAVLPVQLLAQLVRWGKPVLLSRAVRTLIPQPGGEPAVRFAHGGWQRIDRLELELTDI